MYEMILQPQSLTDLALTGVVDIYTKHYGWIDKTWCGTCTKCHTYLGRRYQYHAIIECFEDLGIQNNRRMLYPISFHHSVNHPYMVVVLDNWPITEILRELIKDWRVNPYFYNAMRHIFPYNITKACKGHIISMKNTVVVPWYSYNGFKYYHCTPQMKKRSFLYEKKRRKRKISKATIHDIENLIDTVTINEKMKKLYISSYVIMRL